MADRWRCMIVAGLATAVLGLPATADAAKAPRKRACQSAVKAKKPRCRAAANRDARLGSRGLDTGRLAPVAIEGSGPATRAGAVLEV